ncbi:MAG TPA: PIN domain-containing protein [Ignavibacteriaceae bacterium]|nr:PIN domain-containing protein [Ignavibacteriaceae bacterium]
MKIYLDTCSLQRPFDAKDQVRILLEAEAVLGILSYVEQKKVILISSDALVYEIENIPGALRRYNSKSILNLAETYIKVNSKIEKRAGQLISLGIMPLDALHLSMAESSGADYFCTCDDKLVSKAKRFLVKTKIITPIELIGEIEK